MDLDKVKAGVGEVNGLLEQIERSGVMISRLRREIEDVQKNIERDRDDIRKRCVALSALGVNRITYFEVRDLRRKVTKFIFLKDEDYILLSQALKNINTRDLIVRFESIEVMWPLRVSISMEDITAAANGPPVSVALDLLNKGVAEQEALFEAYNASVRKRQKTKE
jgi:hypothetical protein